MVYARPPSLALGWTDEVEASKLKVNDPFADAEVSRLAHTPWPAAIQQRVQREF